MTKTKKISNMNGGGTRKNKYTKKAHKLKKRVKRTNKQFRKTRSKRQRGGNQEQRDQEQRDQEERDQHLFVAINTGNVDEVHNALNNGANVNAKNGDGDTPLICAITANTTYDTKDDMVQLLLEHLVIEVDLNTVMLAEHQELDDQDQQGMPAWIEKYIYEKNEINENRVNTINELLNYERSNIPSLFTLAYRQVPTDVDTYINLNPGTMNRPSGKLGGKRKTRKSKQKRRLN